MEDVIKARAVLDEYRHAQMACRTLSRKEEFKLMLESSGLEYGHRIFHLVNETFSRLDTDGYYRSPMQRKIQLIICGGVSRFVYGKAMKNNELEIQDYNGFESIDRVIGLTMPRRGGKTESVAQAIAVFLLCIPRIKMIAIAPSIRAAGGDSGLIGHVRRILVGILGYPVNRIGGKKDETILIPGNGPDDIRQFHSYPGGAADK